jgi:hypothetical protein
LAKQDLLWQFLGSLFFRDNKKKTVILAEFLDAFRFYQLMYLHTQFGLMKHPHVSQIRDVEVTLKCTRAASCLCEAFSILGVRRKPQAFARDAVGLWILNPSLLRINELELCNAKPR